MALQRPDELSFPLPDPRRIMSQVLIGTPITHDPATGEAQVTAYRQEFTAVWDTGAPYTVVVPRVIRTANLARRGFRDSGGIDGHKRRRPVYPASIAMPTSGGISLHFTEVTRLERDNQLGEIDVLIGMDIIANGDTTIMRKEDGQLWFTFRPHQQPTIGAPSIPGHRADDSAASNTSSESGSGEK